MSFNARTPPTAQELAAASKLSVYNAEGNEVRLGSLLDNVDSEGREKAAIVIFIRFVTHSCLLSLPRPLADARTIPPLPMLMSLSPLSYAPVLFQHLPGTSSAACASTCPTPALSVPSLTDFAPDDAPNSTWLALLPSPSCFTAYPYRCQVGTLLLLIAIEGGADPFFSLFTSSFPTFPLAAPLFCLPSLQEYLAYLTSHLPLALLEERHIKLSVIGCGAPSLIAPYRENLGTHFDIYADPTKKSYEALGMTLRTLDMGKETPEYQKTGFLGNIFGSIAVRSASFPLPCVVRNDAVEGE